MFYVLEYINNPFEYISNLMTNLHIKGKLIIYTQIQMMCSRIFGKYKNLRISL